MDAPERIWAFHAPDIAETENGATVIAYESRTLGAKEYVRADIHAALQAEVDRLRADLREAAMQALADAGQAQMAYEAQMKAQEEVDMLRAYIVETAQTQARRDRMKASLVAELSGGKSGGSDAH